MIRRPPRSTQSRSSAASDVYKRQSKEDEMKPEDITYGTFALIREMLETTEVVRNFDFKQTMNIAEELRSVDKLLLTGEGSSRIFPAKNTVRKALTMGLD